MGRDPVNDIQVPLTTVSRRHARIFFEVGDYFLEDLGSTHGTEHNGRKVTKGEKRLLRDGDVIKIMSFHITFKTTVGTMLDRKPGEKTEALARRMVQEVLASLGSNQADPPALRIMNGADEGRRFELSEDSAEITIGRSPECDITLNDQNTSRRHCSSSAIGTGSPRKTWRARTVFSSTAPRSRALRCSKTATSSK